VLRLLKRSENPCSQDYELVASIFFIRMFALGTNLSIGIPLVRVGMVVLGSLLGILILKEGFNARYLLGFLLSAFGLYLVMTTK